MIRSNRRTVLKGTLAIGSLAALGTIPFAAARAAPAIFIFDDRFPASRLLAQGWQALGVPILDPRDHDLGIAWRGHIPSLLEAGGTLEGATLWSDRWVCETFARAHGLALMVDQAALPGPAGGGLSRWRLA